MLLVRSLARLVGLAWMLALAALGLGVAAYSVDALVGLGSVRPDRLLGLPSVRRHVGHFLAQLGAHGPVASLSLLCGVGAVVAGVLLIAGLRGSVPRMAVLERDGSEATGTLSARRGPLREMLYALSQRPRHVQIAARPKLSLPRRGHRGQVAVQATYRPEDAEPAQAQAAIEEALVPLSQPFSLSVRVRMTQDRAARRVQ
jgi:hypothetical protein